MENVNDKVGKAAKGHQDPILMSVGCYRQSKPLHLQSKSFEDIKSTSICGLSLQSPKRFNANIVCDV